ncbi:MAG: DUF1553 domain-containing protein [Acidobacteria bacterium]|nr:DUF1553 domain-containing protein [Acidobacteriota bacterium]
MFRRNAPEKGRRVGLGRLGALALGIILAGQGGDSVYAGGSARPFSFPREVGGILTKRGCNNQECHGSVKGRGGFKLSANALYPRDDHEWIVQGGVYQVLSPEPLGSRKPRIDLKQPENSLLLTKPTMEEPHGGGERLSRDSADYRTLVEWIRAGAPYGREEDHRAREIQQLEVSPRQPVIRVDEEQQLLVTATLAGGLTEDVTDQINFESNDPEVAEVSDSGLVRARQPGEAAVVIRAAGRAATVVIGVIRQPLAGYPQTSQRNFIDRLVFAKLRRLHILPSDPSDDRQFLRRVCLDLTGTLPPPERVKEFLANDRPGKRDELIETLLNSPEFLDYWTYRFADLFRVGKSVQGFTKYSRLYWEWIRDGIARNKPYDQMARERIAAQGYGGPALHYYLIGGDLPSPQDMMGEQVRVFLGRRLDCAQCHNHPYEPWSQNQFWGMTAFYGQLTRVGDINTGTAPYNIILDDPEGHGVLGKGGPTVHPRNKTEVQPAFLSGEPAGQNAAEDPRASLAEWMTSPDRPEFAEAIVNRIWGRFFGRGIVDPVDDFKLANPATHPDLLAALAEDFRAGGYDLRQLMRRIVRSRVYQLSSFPNASNRSDRTNYARAHPRPLDAEVLLDAISQVTGVPERFGTKPEGTRAINLVSSDMYPSRFLELYGRPNRQMVPQRKVEASLGQALHLLAGSTYTGKLSGKGSRIDRLIAEGASNAEMVEEFYLAALSRFPTAEERGELEGWIEGQASRQRAAEDLVWALIGSREFAYVH